MAGSEDTSDVSNEKTARLVGGNRLQKDIGKVAQFGFAYTENAGKLVAIYWPLGRHIYERFIGKYDPNRTRFRQIS